MVIARRCRSSLLLCVLGGCFAGAAHGQAEGSRPDPQGRFPGLAAEALDKTVVHLPDQFAGRENLLLLSWARDQGGQVESWTATAQALEHASFEFKVYRMPVSAAENALYRWWDNSSLRAAETDPEMLHWTVPLYTDKAALRHALGLEADEHQIAVVLVDRAGRVAAPRPPKAGLP